MRSSKKDKRSNKKYTKVISLNGRKDPANLVHRYNTYIEDIHIKKDNTSLNIKYMV